jgi:Tfp pilus assembly protein PilO
VTQRDRIVLAVVAVIGVVAGFYLGVVKPNRTEVQDLDTQIAAAEQRRDTALADLQSASVARKQYEQDQRTLAVLGKAVPADDGVPSLLYQLNSVARKAGVDFDSVDVGTGAAGTGTAGGSATPGTTTGTGGLSLLPLTIKFEGSFFELDRFLRGVHRLADISDERVNVRGRLLTVDGVALTPSAAGLPNLEASVTATAYVAEADAKGATATTAGTSGTSTASASGATGASSSTSSSTSSTGSASESAPATSTGAN